jgi:hypothetical protein
MAPFNLHAYRVLSVDENACRVWLDGGVTSVRFSATFPAPRVERVNPGHLVAVASGLNVPAVVVWRWFDTVVLGSTNNGDVRLWEPAHGEVIARPRATYVMQEPGLRAFASAGLPGADWWVACNASDNQEAPNVELAEVVEFYDQNSLWTSAFQLPH